MILALFRAGAPSRLALLGAVAIPCALGRLAGIFSPSIHGWFASDQHASLSMLVLLLVIPTFVAMLGSTLLRGEHAPWTWVLARPLSRRRIIASLVLLDVLTIAACMAAAGLILGGIVWGPLGYRSWTWIDLFGLPKLGLVVAGYAGLYAASAIGGARRMSSLRAGIFALAWIGMCGGAVMLLPEVYNACLDRALHRAWRIDQLAGDEIVHVVFFVLGPVVALGMVIASVIVPFARAAATVPAVMRWRTLLVPSLCTALGAVAVAAGFAALRWIEAPTYARRGSATAYIELVRADGCGSRRCFVVVRPGPSSDMLLHTESEPTRGLSHGHPERVENLADGDWEACVAFRVPVPNTTGVLTTSRAFANCVPFSIADGRDADVTVAFEASSAVPLWSS